MKTTKKKRAFRYIKHPNSNSGDWYNWRVFRQSRLDTKNRKNRKASWELVKVQDEARLYVACTYCGGVNDVTRRPIRPDGFFVSKDCVTCRRCGDHFWPFLSGWKGRR